MGRFLMTSLNEGQSQKVNENDCNNNGRKITEQLYKREPATKYWILVLKLNKLPKLSS
jgi:hypothetical protein